MCRANQVCDIQQAHQRRGTGGLEGIAGRGGARLAPLRHVRHGESRAEGSADICDGFCNFQCATPKRVSCRWPRRLAGHGNEGHHGTSGCTPVHLCISSLAFVLLSRGKHLRQCGQAERVRNLIHHASWRSPRLFSLHSRQVALGGMVDAHR